MKNMHAMVLFLVFITSVSSTLCVSSNNDGNQEISMVVVEDQPSVHDAGIGISKANPVQMAIMILEDGKVLKFSRKSFPGENACINLGQPCGALDHCCDPYYCDGYFTGKCQSQYCQRTGLPCLSTAPCCGYCVGSYCVG